MNQYPNKQKGQLFVKNTDEREDHSKFNTVLIHLQTPSDLGRTRLRVRQASLARSLNNSANNNLWSPPGNCWAPQNNGAGLPLWHSICNDGRPSRTLFSDRLRSICTTLNIPRMPGYDWQHPPAPAMRALGGPGTGDLDGVTICFWWSFQEECHFRQVSARKSGIRFFFGERSPSPEISGGKNQLEMYFKNHHCLN